MNEKLEQQIEDLKFTNKEELEDELSYIREDYKEQIADLREEREVLPYLL
jgi:ribosome-binding protein aMBF1 (putative translation factor)